MNGFTPQSETNFIEMNKQRITDMSNINLDRSKSSLCTKKKVRRMKSKMFYIKNPELAFKDLFKVCRMKRRGRRGGGSKSVPRIRKAYK
jgi:hypothetical protein